MASVTGVRINNLGRSDGATGERLQVSFTVSFSPGERRLGLEYSVHVLLVERDDDLDTYFFNPDNIPGFGVTLASDANIRNTRLVRINRGDGDEPVFYAQLEPITPPANGSVHVAPDPFDIEVGDQENNNEEYRLLVWVFPEVWMGFGQTSRDTVVNLG